MLLLYAKHGIVKLSLRDSNSLKQSKNNNNMHCINQIKLNKITLDIEAAVGKISELESEITRGQDLENRKLRSG